MATHMVKEWKEFIVIYDAIKRGAVDMDEDDRPTKGFYIKSGAYAVSFSLFGKKFTSFLNIAHAKEICDLLKTMRQFCYNNPNDGNLVPYVTSYGNEDIDAFHW